MGGGRCVYFSGGHGGGVRYGWWVGVDGWLGMCDERCGMGTKRMVPKLASKNVVVVLGVSNARVPRRARTRFRNRRRPKNIGALCRIAPKITSRKAPMHAKIPRLVTISRSETSKYAHAEASSHPMPLEKGGGGEGGGGGRDVVFSPALVMPPARPSPPPGGEGPEAETAAGSAAAPVEVECNELDSLCTFESKNVVEAVAKKADSNARARCRPNGRDG